MSTAQLKGDWVLVNGREERHPEHGRFYIDYLQDGKRVRRAAGSTPAEAMETATRQEKLLAAHRAASAAGLVIPIGTDTATGRSLRRAVDDYLAEIKAHKKRKTYLAYRTSLKYFVESCHKQTLEEIQRSDMLAFKTYLKRQHQSDRSAHNKFENVMSFLKRYEVASKLKLTQHDWPTFVEEAVEIYSEEQLTAFLAACTPTERLWFEFFYQTGMREQEVMHSMWSWVDFERNIIAVRENKQFGWQPKKNKGRLIAVPSSLISSLRAWKQKSDPSCGLIFPTKGCKPKLDFLDVCKDIAERAGLNPEDFYLHKFRATRITNWLRDGLDLKSVQDMAGHSDLASTSRYLASQQIDVLQQRIEAAANGNGRK